MSGTKLEEHTLLTPEILEGLNFKDNGKCDFKHYDNMNYWVREGFCLFYNTPILYGNENHFYAGYAEMRSGEYVAVAFRWITSLEGLKQIFEGIMNKPLEMNKPTWVEIKGKKVRTFQLGEEPELIHILNVRHNEYLVVQEDGYDLNTGKVEFFNKKQIKNKYKIKI